MTPWADRTCKRCSVKRVNALIKTYQQAHGQDDAVHLHRLREVSSLCAERGFGEGSRLLRPGLNSKDLRSLCWNVSSFLEDDEAEAILGIKL